MRSAAICGGSTALGLFLAIWAVYRGVRLDWTETALVTGIVLLVVGLRKGMEILKEMGCDDEEE